MQAKLYDYKVIFKKVRDKLRKLSRGFLINAEGLSSRKYFYNLKAASFIETKKMVIAK